MVNIGGWKPKFGQSRGPCVEIRQGKQTPDRLIPLPFSSPNMLAVTWLIKLKEYIFKMDPALSDLTEPYLWHLCIHHLYNWSVI